MFDRRLRIALFIWTVLLAVAPGAGAVSAEDNLPFSIQTFLLRHKIPVTSLSVFVQEVDAQTPLLTVAGQIPRNPASVIKVLTTFAALDTLGPSYTWRTDAFSTAKLKNGKLQGDLYLKGSGDPFLVTERFWKFLLGIRNTGIQHISGDLIIDNSLFATGSFDPGEFDNRPERPYNVGPDALLVTFGVISFWLVPDSGRSRVNIATDPPSSTLNIDNRVTLSNERCNAGADTFRFRRIRRHVARTGWDHQRWISHRRSAIECSPRIQHQFSNTIRSDPDNQQVQ